VIQTAVLYAVASWALSQVAELLLCMLEVPPWGLKLVFVLLLIGFPLALLLSWMHQVTPEGIRPETTAPQTQRGLPPAGAFSAHTADAPSPARPPRDAAVDERSIAVLPFANLSEDKANEYFADGLSGSRIRITAQLVRASDSSHVWSQTFDRDLSDIFAVQDEIATAVAGELAVKLLGRATPKARPTDPRAYSLYQQGRHFFSLLSASGFERAIPAIEEALAIDPEFAPAWGVRGALYWGQANNSLIPYETGARKARLAWQRALALDPEQAEPLSLLGLLDVIEHREVVNGLECVRRDPRLSRRERSRVRVARARRGDSRQRSDGRRHQSADAQSARRPALGGVRGAAQVGLTPGAGAGSSRSPSDSKRTELKVGPWSLPVSE
jgi:adenylate cyclase